MRVVCISDTHGHTPEIPEGDVLIHAGDSSGRGSATEIADFSRWLHSLPHQHKVVIAGNHDFLFQDSPNEAVKLLCGDGSGNIHYLMDSEITISVGDEKLRLYGSPWQPRFFNWAFNLDTVDLFDKWQLIPDGIDVLITHGPPYQILDRTSTGLEVGCHHLLDAVMDKKPKMHVFGHIHESYGTTKINDIYFVNASTCTLRYKPSQCPIIFDYNNGIFTPVSDSI